MAAVDEHPDVDPRVVGDRELHLDAVIAAQVPGEHVHVVPAGRDQLHAGQAQERLQQLPVGVQVERFGQRPGAGARPGRREPEVAQQPVHCPDPVRRPLDVQHRASIRKQRGNLPALNTPDFLMIIGHAKHRNALCLAQV